MARYKPFCSKRCADIDLGKWLGDGYRVQGSEEEDQASAELIDLAAERQFRQK